MYATPLGDILIDQEENENLLTKYQSKFSLMSQAQDENEHSLEMQLPFIHQIMSNSEDKNFKVLPILVGNVDLSQQREYGKIFSEYLNDPQTIFIVSSDFCHWGDRFDFTYYRKEDGEIYESIEKLDRRGMDLIESKSLAKFTRYLGETKNTICGRYPIAVFMAAMECNSNFADFNLTWVKYAQSSQVTSADDSSVSYAAAVCYC